MNKYLFALSFLIAILAAPLHADAGNYKEVINTGSWNIPQLDNLLARASRISDTPSRIDFFSSQFSGIPYKAATLIGDQQTQEALVINLTGVDCFTFLDYVEAMRRSGSFTAFKENLRKVRYQNGVVDYKCRNHFYSDWIVYNAGFIDDVTGQIGAGKTKTVIKILNASENGKQLLPGIAARKREVNYLPSENIDNIILARLKTGDYLGIYTAQKNLDVSHVGIVIRKGAGIFFRHASSQEKYRTVVDEDLKSYLSHKPGVIILRPIGNDKSKLSLRGVPIYWDDVAISESFNGASPSLHSGLRLTRSQ
ncbi:MAG: DUF1460 domain-containing protein [Proteobacteria bacterium]|nr:DUF1460 domain-containing protein [Pseudomonadota bacterium]